MIRANALDYIPAELSGLRLGMFLDEFKVIKDISQMEIDDNDYITYVTEDIEDENILQFTYQFSKEKILYEIIIQYRGTFDVQLYMVKLYGPPNNGEEWILEYYTGERVKIWRFSKSFCIADAKYFEI